MTTLYLKGLRLNRDKTKYMHCSFGNRQTHEDLEITLVNQSIQEVDKFKYLRSIIQKDCEVDEMLTNTPFGL